MDGSVLKKSGDSYFLKLENAFDVSVRHDYKTKLTQTELEEILLYLKVLNKSNQPLLAH